MIGFSLSVNELKGSVTEELIAKTRNAGYRKGLKYLKDELRGNRIFHAERLSPWSSLPELIKYLESGNGSCQLLYNGGYPYLLIAQGKDIIHHIADAPGSQQTELRELLDGEAFYLLEAWDLS